MNDFAKIRRIKIFEVLDRFPDLPTRTIARVLFKEAPELFNNPEHARNIVRYLRGANGDKNRETLKIEKYVKPL